MSVLSWPWELSSISESSDVECSLGSPVLGDHNTGIKIIFYTSIVNNTGIKNYSSIVNFLPKKYDIGIKSYSSIVYNTVRK